MVSVYDQQFGAVLKVQFLSADGMRSGDPVNPGIGLPNLNTRYFNVQATTGGGFLIVYSQQGSDSQADMYLNRYDRDGVLVKTLPIATEPGDDRLLSATEGRPGEWFFLTYSFPAQQLRIRRYFGSGKVYVTKLPTTKLPTYRQPQSVKGCYDELAPELLPCKMK